jgi:hypothetical protein
MAVSMYSEVDIDEGYSEPFVRLKYHCIFFPGYHINAVLGKSGLRYPSFLAS